MTTATGTASDALALAGVDRVLDAVLCADLTGPSADELLDSLQTVERLRNRMAGVEQALTAELDSRRVGAEYGCATTAALLSGALRIPRGEASARLAAAQAAGPRRALTGEQLGPVYPHVAAAQSDGSISARHAALIVRTVDRLPTNVTAVNGEAIEAGLVDAARTLDTSELGRACERMRQHYDPDGTLPDDGHRQRTRDLAVRTRADGSSGVSGELTPECTELLQTCLDTLARPVPESDGVPDPRTRAQRRHDGLLELCRLAIRSEQLPDCGGVTTTVVVTMSDEAYRTGRGAAWTAHGTPMRARDALAMAGADHRVLTVALDSLRGVVAYGTCHRLFSPNQRLVFIARDGGCSFPGCTAPPSWCQADHIVDYAKNGETSVVNGHLLCGFHHRFKDQYGWSVAMLDGRPAWFPPGWIDRDRRPRYNTTHRPYVPLPAPPD